MSRVIWCENWIWPLFYGFCPDEAAWKREMKKMDSVGTPYPQLNAPTSAQVMEFTPTTVGLYNPRLIVTMGHRPDRTPMAAALILQHEAVHIFQHLCITIKETKPSIEFEAYMIEAMTRELLLAYEKTRGKLFRGR